MRTAKSGRRRHLYVPFVYLLIVGSLLYLQFGGLRTHRERIGGLELTTTRSRSLRGDDRLRRRSAPPAGLHYSKNQKRADFLVFKNQTPLL